MGVVRLTMHSIDSADGLELFQSGKTPESEQEWDQFVPPQALEALGKKEWSGNLSCSRFSSRN